MNTDSNSLELFNSKSCTHKTAMVSPQHRQQLAISAFLKAAAAAKRPPVRGRIRIRDLLLISASPSDMSNTLEVSTFKCNLLPAPPIMCMKRREGSVSRLPPLLPSGHVQMDSQLPRIGGDPAPAKSTVPIITAKTERMITLAPTHVPLIVSNESALNSTKVRTPTSVRRSTEDYKHTHMIAERKRRREMKEVFDRLSSILPSPSQEQDSTPVNIYQRAGHKRSKWDTLVDAIELIDLIDVHRKQLSSTLRLVLQQRLTSQQN